MGQRHTPYRDGQTGGALPLALFLTLVLAMSGAITTKIAQLGLRKIPIAEATTDTFQVAEGAAHQLLSQMSGNPELWRELNPIQDLPAGYTQYSPAALSASNGIPSCSSRGCHRNYFPVGGGLVKNFGPLTAEGGEVDTAYAIADQLDPENPPDPDAILNGRDGWVQVERLEEISISAGSLGGGLENNRSGGSRTGVVRFRLSAVADREVRGRRGRSTLVMVVEMPTT
jgi:hypothetical protein